MAKGNFPNCNAITRKWEGGDVNHPADPGGLTSRGVTAARGAQYRKLRRLPPKPVTQWTNDEVDQFYYDEFWTAMECERLACGVDLAVYDAGVNSGPGRARRWLGTSIGGVPIDTIKSICKARLSFVQGLKTWRVFGKGWARRIAGIEASAVSMWLVWSKRPYPTDVLRDEADIAEDRADVQQKAPGAVVAGGATVGGGDAIVNGAVNWWLVAAIALGVAAAVAAASVVAYRNRARASAYRAEALALLERD